MSTEIKPGYKMTEVGVTPEDWSVEALGAICTTSSGTTPSRSQADRYFRGGAISWVKTLDLNNSEIIHTEEHVTQAALDETSLKVYPAGTVLIAMYGGFNQIGRTGLLRIQAAVNQAITAVQTGRELDPDYLLATLNFRVEHWKSVASSSRKDPNITSQDIRNFLLAYPSHSEQSRIASALSSIDALLRGLDQLLAKKRDIKQAAMQQLLTGQKRLPGFSGEWEVKRLGDLVTRMANGAVYIRDEKNGVPITRIETISSGVIDWERIGYAKATPELAQYEMQSGDILYSHINSLDHIGKVAHYSGSESLYHGMNLILLRPNSNANAVFLFMLLGSDMIRQKARVLAKQAVSQASINTADLKSMELRLPGHDEQVAISAILSDMDAELAALEARRDKARQLKQGMMQDLLTGRIRLV